MAPVDRNNPKRAASSGSQHSLMEFMREFPDDAACLAWLWRARLSPDGEHAHCPACDKLRRFHKVKGRPAWDCDRCGHHLHPTAGTIFHKSSTSLHLWFYAMWLITSTRCGVSAKQLERELGVTYKTAWRMFPNDQQLHYRHVALWRAAEPITGRGKGYAAAFTVGQACFLASGFAVEEHVSIEDPEGGVVRIWPCDRRVEAPPRGIYLSLEGFRDFTDSFIP